MEPNLQVIEYYHDRGFSIMPLAPKSKRPIIRGWQKLRYTTAADQVVRFYGRISPNYGVITGEASNNAICIDNDNFWDEWIDDYEVQELLKKACIVKTSRSYHIWIKIDSPLQSYSWTAPNGSVAGEVRANGGQVVVPPSIHPSGHIYEIVQGDMGELPIIGIEMLKRICPPVVAVKPTEIKKYFDTHAGTKVNMGIEYGSIDWAALFRDQGMTYRETSDRIDVLCPNQDQHSTGHAGDSSTSLLLNHPSGRVIFKCLHGHCQHIDGFFLEEYFGELVKEYGKPYTPPPEDVSEIKQSVGKMLDKKKIEVIEEEAEEESVIDKTSEYIEPSDRILCPPGIIGHITDWMSCTARKPQPLFNLGATLTMFGSLLGQRIQSETDARTNIYIITLGATGCGKDHPLNAVDWLLTEAGHGNLITGSDFTSETALERVVELIPTCLIQIDEVSEVLKGILDPSAKSHIAKIGKVLMQLYSSSHRTYRGKEYANNDNNPRRIIEQPCVSWYGTTTPAGFYDLIGENEINSGMLNRIIVLESKFDPKINRNAEPLENVPKSFLERIKSIREMPTAKNIYSTKLSPETIPFEPNARKRWYEFEDYIEAKEKNIHNQLWNRSPLNAMKTALTLAGGDGRKTTPVQYIDYGIELLEFSTENLVRSTSKPKIRGEYAELVDSIETYVKRKKECSGKELTKRFFKVKKQLREEVIAAMVEIGYLEEITYKSANGKIGKKYSYKM